MKKTFFLLATISTVTLAMAQHKVEVSYVDLNAEEICANPVQSYTQPASLEGRANRARLYPDIEFQTLLGIGGCFNEIGGEALASLDKETQAEVLNALFNTDSGSGFTFCRAAIGASDFGIDAYSFSEVADDYKMKHFSTKRDAEYMMPYIQKAIKVNSDLKLFGSPWSPPAWMKESGYMDRGNEFSSKNVLKDDPKIYEAYALYFVKYVEAYKKAGIDVDRILIQNEQDFNTKYPSCRLLVEQMSKFVKGYMRPLFTEKKVDTEIWAGTFRAAGEAEALKFAANSDYMEDFDGIGIQYTRAQYMHDMTLLAPNVKFMHTEGVCFNGGNTIDQAKTRLEEVAAYINSGSENFCYWNMILNESGLSGWGWKQNALINIDRETKSVTYNPDYAVMNLMSKYVQPDAVRIGAFSYQTMIVTKKGGDYFIVMQNDEDKDTLYNIYIGNELVKFAIPANSLCGVKISK